MVFGRCFETALAAYFSGQDCTAVLFKEWNAYREAQLEYGKSDSWDKLLHQGIHLLHKFAQDDRVQIKRSLKTLIAFLPQERRSELLERLQTGA
jgi:hypothetical protein